MNALDALVLMSRSTRTWKEQFGRVIMEAQACGVPVIGSDSGNIPSVIAGGGWTVPEGDTATLTQLLSDLAEKPDLLTKASNVAAYQASTRFSPRTIGAALSSAYYEATKIRLRATRRNASFTASPT